MDDGVCLSVHIVDAAPPLTCREREVAFFFPLFSQILLRLFAFLLFLPTSVPDYLVVIQVEELIVFSLVVHALEVHPVPQDP